MTDVYCYLRHTTAWASKHSIYKCNVDNAWRKIAEEEKRRKPNISIEENKLCYMFDYADDSGDTYIFTHDKYYLERETKTKVVHCKKSKYDVYIGRPSEWGNPFTHLNDGLAKYKVESRKEAIEKYEEWIQTQPELMERVHGLHGKRLGCWCAPYPCHGHVLARLAKAAFDAKYPKM